MKEKFLETISTLQTDMEVHNELIINLTPTPMGKWTMDEHGARQVGVAALDD